MKGNIWNISQLIEEKEELTFLSNRSSNIYNKSDQHTGADKFIWSKEKKIL